MARSFPSEASANAVVAEKLRQRRVALAMSQGTLAESLGVTAQQVQKMETGVNRVSAGRLYQLAMLLGVPTTYFYEGLDRVDIEPETNHVAASYFLGRKDGQRMANAMLDIPQPLRSSIMRLIDQIDETIKLKP